MCGIVAKAGPDPALAFVRQGLCRLEYRGYDGWGYAARIFDGSVLCHRATGAVSRSDDLPWREGANVAIGHTRWASHGGVSERNAHPVEGGARKGYHWPAHREGDRPRQFVYPSSVYVVHNGVIDNHAELRGGLLSLGHVFATDTDTESLAHLLARHVPTGGSSDLTDLADAMADVRGRLEGRYAYVALHKYWADRCLFAAREGSPLVVSPQGHVASDPLALAGHAERFFRVPDGHGLLVWLDPEDNPSIHLIDFAARAASPSPDGGIRALRDPEDFPEIVGPARPEPGPGAGHAMPREIREQARFRPAVRSPEMDRVRPRSVVLTGCGSSYNACLMARPWLEQWLHLPVHAEYASELTARDPNYPPGTVLVALTQSGETADVLAALEQFGSLSGPGAGSARVVVTNNEFSAAARLADWVVPLGVGPETAVAATKTFTSSYMALLRLGAAFGPPALKRTVGPLLDLAEERLPASVADALSPGGPESARAAARWLAGFDRALFLGRGCHYALAREGALKLKEVSYIHAEAMPAAEMKHGPIALVDGKTLCVFLAGEPCHRPKAGSLTPIAANMSEVKARGGAVLLVAPLGVDYAPFRGLPDLILGYPDAEPLTRPVLAAVALQLLAYYAALERGLDPDRPRNLSKSVTV